MDVNTLLKLMMSTASTDALTQNTGLSADKISGVMNSILPTLISGAGAQASNADTAAGFLQAIENHGNKDTKDLNSFLSSVDLADGAKIVQHLLGGNTAATAQTAAKAAGVSEADVKKILAMVSPLLLSILGQQKKKHGNDSASLLQNLMTTASGSGLDAGGLLSFIGKLLK